MGDLAKDDGVRIQLLHAGAASRLFRLAHMSRSALGRYEARRALVVFASRAKEVIARRETEVLACALRQV